ncbi:MAG: hypothetical protein ABII06_04775, partial [Pseudomonadota bacterium]
LRAELDRQRDWLDQAMKRPDVLDYNRDLMDKAGAGKPIDRAALIALLRDMQRPPKKEKERAARVASSQ